MQPNNPLTDLNIRSVDRVCLPPDQCYSGRLFQSLGR